MNSNRSKVKLMFSAVSSSDTHAVTTDIQSQLAGHICSITGLVAVQRMLTIINLIINIVYNLLKINYYTIYDSMIDLKAVS